MDLHDPNRFLHRKPTTSSERFLGVSPHVPFVDNPSSSSSINGADELSEDDVVFLGGDYTQHNHSSTPSSSSTSSTPRHQLHNSHNNYSHKGFGPPDAFGILAALPENEASVSGRNGSHFFHRSSVSSASSSSSSSSRLIPVIPKPPQDRIPLHSLSSPSVKYHHHSAPVNVPILSQEMMKARRRHREFDEDVGDEDDEDEQMLPPHEIVARNSAQTCSVLEGSGRTLKGRDLCKVRNAVLQQTGGFCSGEVELSLRRDGFRVGC